nr:urease accessory UreF family protein [Notoacmeibacter sp. MSK16QG-6]
MKDAAQLEERLRTLLHHGAPWNDAVLLIAAHSAADDSEAIDEFTALARALCGSAERLRETLDQGRAFRTAAMPWFDETTAPLPEDASLPITLGVASARYSLPTQETAAAFLHAFVSAQLQAAIRLSITGQSGAAATLARLEPDIGQVVERATKAKIDDLGTCTLAAEIDALRHETLPGRLFLS